MTSSQVVETSVKVTSNSPSQDYSHPDDHNLRTNDMTPGFKPFTDFEFSLIAFQIYFFQFFHTGPGQPRLTRPPKNPRSTPAVSVEQRGTKFSSESQDFERGTKCREKDIVSKLLSLA